ncbi:MAG: FAD-dependent oxidoreductase [Crocinitomicaceae bacterium]|nr:FAD-dependent oxidoreductase [Crocinitomicaceae bacterium]
MKSCVVIGGGVVGLCSAYYLAKAGHQVTIIDQSDLTDGCSYGNAGMIVPSHVIPLAHPGMISQGMKWMFNSKSPFYVRPRLSAELFSWGWQFYKHSTKAHVERSMPALHDLSMFSKELFQDLAKQADFLYQEKGLLMLYKTEKVGEEEIHAGNEAKKLGLEVDFLSKEEVAKLERGIKTDSIGAVHYKSDAHLYPQRFMQFLKDEIVALGVSIKKNASIQKFEIQNGKISSVEVENQIMIADEFILCAGSWSPEIAKKLGIKLHILPGKGYSFNTANEGSQPSIPSILCEGKVAVTPMGDQVRFGGTMEVTHTNDHRINTNRVQGIVDTINQFYPEIAMKQPNASDVWHGFRPCTPTGLPLISRSTKVNNLVIATGHAMMGLSLGPATGKLVEEIVGGRSTSVNIDRFK